MAKHMTLQELYDMECNILSLIGYETFFNTLVKMLNSDQREELYKDVCIEHDIDINDIMY